MAADILPVGLQGLPELPGLLTTLIVVAVVLFVGRILLNVALKVVIVVAVLVGVGWLLAAADLLPL